MSRISRKSDSIDGIEIDIVEHNSLWETLALFINTDREENTGHSVEYFCFLLFLDFLDE